MDDALLGADPAQLRVAGQLAPEAAAGRRRCRTAGGPRRGARARGSPRTTTSVPRPIVNVMPWPRRSPSVSGSRRRPSSPGAWFMASEPASVREVGKRTSRTSTVVIRQSSTPPFPTHNLAAGTRFGFSSPGCGYATPVEGSRFANDEAAVPARQATCADVLGALALVTQGRVYNLDCGRFPGMPIFPGHPPFQVLSYRTPRGIANQGDQEWLAENEPGFYWQSEMVMGTVHSGTHVDALSHITCGERARVVRWRQRRRAPRRLRPAARGRHRDPTADRPRGADRRRRRPWRRSARRPRGDRSG